MELGDLSMVQAVCGCQSKPKTPGWGVTTARGSRGVGTYPVPVGADLLHLEALGTVALGHLPVHLEEEPARVRPMARHQPRATAAPWPYLVLDLIGIRGPAQWVPVGVQGADEFVVVDEAVPVHVKDARHSVHLQDVGGELWGGTGTLSPAVPCTPLNQAQPALALSRGPPPRGVPGCQLLPPPLPNCPVLGGTAP